MHQQPVTGIQKTKFRSFWKDIIRDRTLYLFISPFFILFFAFGLFPILFAIYLSLTQWDGIGEMNFVGLDNFRFLLSDPLFYSSLYNTLIIWLLAIIPSLMMALTIAYIINLRTTNFKQFYKVAYFIPNVTATVAVAIIFGSMFATQYGIINFFITSIGFERINWLTNTFGVKVVIASMVIWGRTGYYTILYIAGLQRIPNELYEAARIDGCNSLQAFFRITIPLMRPIILFTVILSTIQGMQIFTEPQILGDGGTPLAGSRTVVLHLYDQAFRFNQFGYGAALSWALFLIIVVFSIMNWQLVQRPGRRKEKKK